MAKQDYYDTLGLRAAPPRRHQEGLSQARHAAPPGPQSGRPDGRAQVQGDQRSLRRPQGRAEARRLRPLRPCGVRERRRAAAARLRFRLRRRLCRHLRRDVRRIHGRPPRRTGARRARGADLRYNLEITLEEAFAGKQATIRVPTSVACEDCKGTGGEGRAPARLPAPATATAGCAPRRASSPSSAPARPATARGAIIEKPCRSCQGAGRVRKERTLSVTIPAGVEDGTRIRLAGEGEAGLRGAPAGDLYIFLSIAPHRVFQRDGAHLYCRCRSRWPRRRSAAWSRCRRSTAAARA